ncbi:hypothetical protein [Anditalea andensis]|uniref:Uncharacterized protein n=1 Tax=Anditalea andensis TaxID=1048983 RepID=A0A074KQ39_9BACT|nr:hypothetical protein [Anditalea andensis]KEO72061.1 hypothetical protein EL17_19300 [Anditalea andensis]
MPLVIKTLFGYQFEMYPAIILPSGPHIKTLEGNTIMHRNLEFFVQEAGGPWKQLDPVAVFSPLPEQYSSPILRREFGLLPPRTYPERRFFKILKKMHLLDPRVPNDIAINELKSWIQSNIAIWVQDADKIKIEAVEKTIDLQGNVLKRQVESAQIIHLH